MSSFAENLAAIQAELKRVGKIATRDPQDVTLVAVTKTHGVDRVIEALQSGLRVFGENRVQEAAEKYPALQQQYPDLELHLIGPLQSNKVKTALTLFDVIETLDRESLALSLAKEIQKIGRAPTLWLQVNTGHEPQKAGLLPDKVDDFLLHCRKNWDLEISGLMCIPPAGQEPSPHFALLRTIAVRNGLNKLSMGMSQDYSIGFQLGATHIRLGTALFGNRD